jgi:hypothetical protein
MGRPLKIQKYSAMTGIFVSGPTADATPVDQAFNPWSALTNAQYPATFNTDQYYGVVGGASNTGTSATFPIVKCRAFITGSGGEDDAQIIRQKGAHKFLVIQVTSINVTSTVASNAYRILTVGTTTTWTDIGGPANPAVGDIFTATGVGTGDGTVQLVGTCVLADEADGALTEGNMNITYTLNDSTATRISKLTNKFLLNFAGGNPGGAADTGNAWDNAQVINDERKGPNFFTDEGSEVKSGSANTNSDATYPGTNLDLAIVENYTV